MGSQSVGAGGAPVVARAPLGLTAPTGWDGTVVLIDEDRVYAYKI
ncbi:MAG: hypothetical protein NZ890_03075 [Myxococcota bacterium]|nr:hypothetical protein [Myxococcota bacterium]